MIQITTIIEQIKGGGVNIRSQGDGKATNLEAHYGDHIAAAIHFGGEYARQQCGAILEREIVPFQITRKDAPAACQSQELKWLLNEAGRLRQMIALYEQRQEWEMARARAEHLSNIYRQLDLIRIRDTQENQPTKGHNA